MKKQCDSAIRILEQNNQDMEIVVKQLTNFTEDEELESEAYNALKQQMNDYITITSAMIEANELDMIDLQKLKDLIGNQELHGDEIIAQRDAAYTDIMNYSDLASMYGQKASAEPWLSIMHEWYNDMNLFYSARVTLAENRYNKWLEREQKYDEIEVATQNLFTESATLRRIARLGLESITGAFQNGNYMINMNADWRMEMISENNRLIQEMKKRFLTTDENGKQIYNWLEIRAWFKKDAEDITELEYLAFADLMSEMSVEDLQTMFSYAQLRNNPIQPSYNEISEVMKSVSERYLMIAEIEAELVIFDKQSDYDERNFETTNQLSRAILVRQIVQLIDDGGYHEVIISERVDNGMMVYEAVISNQPLGTVSYQDVESLGRVVAAEQQKKTVTVYPWGTPMTAEVYLDENVENTLNVLTPSYEEVVGENISELAIDFVISKIGGSDRADLFGGIAETVWISGEMALELNDTYESKVVIEGGLESIHTGQEIQSMGIDTGVVTVTGSGVNSVELYCPRYDMEELTVRVAAYNESNYPSTTVEELTTAYESGMPAFQQYMNWYYGEGNGEVEAYWNELDKVAIDYRNSNLSGNSITIKEMSIPQLQELINKYNDSTYEINAEIMGE